MTLTAADLKKLAAYDTPTICNAMEVVAPERDRSGASNSLTLDRPLTVRRAASGYQYVNGTPTDCVHLALCCLGKPLLPVVPVPLNWLNFFKCHISAYL